MEAESFPESLSVPNSQAVRSSHLYGHRESFSAIQAVLGTLVGHACRSAASTNDALAFDRTLRIPDVLLEPPPPVYGADQKPAPSRGLDGQTAQDHVI
jgi:hypothetical protein